VGDRQHPVMLAPDDHRRHVLGQVQAIARIDQLPARPDDAAQGAQERRPGVAIAQRRVRAGVELGVGGRAQAQRAAGASRQVDQRPERGRGQPEEQFAAGQRGEPKNQPDI